MSMGLAPCSLKKGGALTPPPEGDSPTLVGKSAKLAKIIDDTKNELTQGKYTLGEKIEKMNKDFETLEGLKRATDKEASLPDSLKNFLAAQLELNRETIEGFKALSCAMEGWGNCVTQIDESFKDLNKDISFGNKQVAQVNNKLKSVDDKVNQKKVIEEVRKADMTLKIVQLKVDMQTDNRDDCLSEGAKAALKACKNPNKVKNKLKKLNVASAANNSYVLDAGHHVDLKVICNSREDRFALDKELKNEGLKTAFYWPSAIFKQIKAIRQKYFEQGSIKVDNESIDMTKVDLLIRPTRSCERLVIKLRPKGGGNFVFLETIGMPFNNDLSLCGSRFWKV